MKLRWLLIISLLFPSAFARTELIAPDGQAGNRFGYSLSVSGETLAISGAWLDGYEDGGKKIYVYQNGTEGWRLVAELSASDGNHMQGVAISGNTIVAGAPANDDSQMGCAYVFVAGTSGWHNATETAILTPSDGPSLDFGIAVAINSKTIIVGSANSGDNQQGQAYVYVEPENGWQTGTETAKLLASNGQQGDGFGASVSVNGVVAAVGAPGVNNIEGAVYIFQETVGGWQDMTETAELTEGQPIALESLGTAVAIHSGTVIAGAPGDANAAQSTGRALVFIEPPSGWQSTAIPNAILTSTETDPKGFGTSVAINTNVILVGDPYSAHYNKQLSGAVFVFDKPTNGWINATQSETINASGTLVGISVALSFDNKAFIGAPMTTVGSNYAEGVTFISVTRTDPAGR